MDTHAKIAPVSSVQMTPGQGDLGDETRPRSHPHANDTQPVYRLVIEEGPSNGTFIYKTLDSVTGEIVRQFPREEVVRMAQENAYSAGSLIDTSA